ncbi:hypothetical protein J4N46_04510 [Capnocytophaga sp. Marseille-Q4570]|uniref:Uncharacterized protein n=1 Tax=Capnocytophaga bilenii TaxID=2819369 RepID=A0ABS3PWK5_9FLAO|nr:hypothetical protein [Capnocytophaga bilenii]MBO1883700.1 hypothetical protein [Capnocytophaga bilenii]
MGKSEYYFMRKNSQEEYFPCRVIKQHNSWDEVENLETGEKEDRIHNYYKTEIDVRFEKRAQQINSFIEKKGVVLHPFVCFFGEINLDFSPPPNIFVSLTKKDDIKNLEEKFNNEWNEYLKEVENCRIERNIKWKELIERLKALNCVFTIEDLFEVLEKKYNIILSSEEKKNIILELDKPREDNQKIML